MIRRWLPPVLIASCLIGCGNDLGYSYGLDGPDAGEPDAAPVAHGGLPCAVQSFLADHCQSCHGTTPSGGAPISLVTYADLTARAGAGMMVAQRVLARIKSPSAPMPPGVAPTITPADAAILEAWISAGVPAAECTADPAPGPFDGPPVCSSGRTWTGGDRESPQMHPGLACIACHTRSEEEGPRFRIGGTVYPTGHEPNDCYGATSAVVEVTDATGRVITLPINAAGNFFTSSAIASPIHVAVVANGKRRSMGASPPTGDCNSCHTQNGANGAPGRIALP